MVVSMIIVCCSTSHPAAPPAAPHAAAGAPVAPLRGHPLGRAAGSILTEGGPPAGHDGPQACHTQRQMVASLAPPIPPPIANIGVCSVYRGLGQRKEADSVTPL